MRGRLRLHPASRSAADGIAAEADRSGTRFHVRFEVTGDMSRILLPGPRSPDRADGLWRSTCFEAFLRRPGETSYVELNLSPSTRWAAYRFRAWREGMEPLPLATIPEIETLKGSAAYCFGARLDLGESSDFAIPDPWQVGLSAILEEASGERSYWALAFAPGDPDFHHEDCFAGELAAAA